MRPRVVICIFGVLALFFLGQTVVWLALDRAPPTWDDAGYLTNSLTQFDSLVDGGVSRYVRTFLKFTDKPPLIAALPTPIYLLAGRHVRAAYVVNLVSMLVLFAAVYRLARQRSSARAGLLAVYLVGTMPMMYGLARWFLVECTLIAIVAAVICIAAELNFDDGRKVAGLGFLCGWGLLLKFTFPLYVVAPLAYYAWRKPSNAFRLKALLALALPAAALALPWYLPHFRSALATALDTGSADVAAQFTAGQPYSAIIFRAYFVRMLNAGPALYFAVLPAWLVLVFRRLSPGARDALRLCAVWASPLVFLLLWRSREARYGAPLYPALALALAVLMDAALSRYGKWFQVLSGVLLLLPLISMLQASFGVLGRAPLQLGGLLFDPHNLVYARRFDSRRWPFPEVLEDLHRAASSLEGKHELLLVGSDSPEFNADNFKLAAAEHRLPLAVATTAYERNWTAVPPLLERATFFLYEDGGEPRSIFFNALGMRAFQEVQQSEKFLELPLHRRLPDGGVVRVFENLSKDGFVRTATFIPSSLQAVPEADVVFANNLQLSGFGFTQSADAVDVKYRWRSLRPIDREYWCFTHVLDAQGKAVAFLDHRILNGSPPMTRWKAGDEAVEGVHLHFPEIQPGGKYRLRVGLFDRATGERVTITSSVFPMADKKTAVIVSGP